MQRPPIDPSSPFERVLKCIGIALMLLALVAAQTHFPDFYDWLLFSEGSLLSLF